MNSSIPALISLILGFLICSFVPENRFIQEHIDANPEDREDNTGSILIQRLLVIFFFGFIPLVIHVISGNDLSESGLNAGNMVFSLISGLVTGSLLILINFLNRRNPATFAMYPMIRKKVWNMSLVVLSALSWVVYLFSYEFLFRGYLLFSMNREFGVWNAVVINIVLYSLVHVPKGWKEAVGAIPLGFVFCFMCIHAGNMWPSFIAHTCLALSNEWFALALHPEIRVIKNKRSV